MSAICIRTGGTTLKKDVKSPELQKSSGIFLFQEYTKQIEFL